MVHPSAPELSDPGDPDIFAQAVPLPAQSGIGLRIRTSDVGFEPVLILRYPTHMLDMETSEIEDTDAKSWDAFSTEGTHISSRDKGNPICK